VLALQAGIIRQRLFVALVVMAIVTSMISGPVMRLILRPARKRRLHDAITPKLFLRELQAVSPREAIREMTAPACEAAGLDFQTVEAAVWAREESLSTGIGNGVALPHGRIDGLTNPLIVVGLSDAGIDFDAPDGELAHVVFLVLTPRDDYSAQLELGAGIARVFREEHMLERVLRTRTFTDFLALLRSAADESESS
jgi:mannitol/fructose-specific phosphotransferase system IIA component (Ntr-type)